MTLAQQGAPYLRAMSVDEKRRLLTGLVLERQGRVPVSFAQRCMWLAEQLDPGTPMHTILSALRLGGRLDPAALSVALSAVSDRHCVLRTTFVEADGDVTGRIAPAAPVPMPLVDLSELPEAAREARLTQLIERARDTVLDLAAGPLLRASLVRLQKEEHVLLVTMHHIVFDDWSRFVFCQELVAGYDAALAGNPARLPELPLRYHQFAARERGRAGVAARAGSLAYWREQLCDLPDTELPGSRPRPAEPGWAGGQLVHRLPRELTRRIIALGQARGATPYMTFLSAFQVLLHRHTSAADLAVASPIAGRTSADVEPLIGMFVNTVVLRSRLSGRPRFTDVLEQTRQTAIAAYTHQEVPLDVVVDELRPERTAGRMPFTQVMFSLHNAPEPALDLSALRVDWLDVGIGAAKTDLLLAMGGQDDELDVAWIYRTEVYDLADIEQLHARFETLLSSLAADPEQHMDRLALLPEPERARLLLLGRGEPDQAEGTLHGRFARHALADPDAVAVVAPDGQFTYGELRDRALALAYELTDAGVSRGDLVAIAIDRSAAMAVAVLAVLQAGAAYVPLDPTLPQRRLAAIVTDARPVAFLSTGDSAGLDPGDAPVLRVDTDAPVGPPARGREPARVSGGDLAYILYTSGSTGTPKGVAVEHRQVLNYLDGIDATAGLGAGRYAMVQPLAVDSSVIMLHGAFHHCGTLYPVGRDVALDGHALAAFLADHRIDFLKIAPSHLAALQQATAPEDLLPARWIMVGGEGSSWSWARELAAGRAGCAAYNHYGPTEATVGVLVRRIGEGDAIDAAATPLGRPLVGARLYVLDAAGDLAPSSAIGEIYIGGTPVARGYLGRPAQTAEVFLPDPFVSAPGARMYRTGDRGRWRTDGTLEFLGRDDGQIKIRGNRVELGDIQAALRSHPTVHDAVVTAPLVDGERRIYAYVVGAGGIAPAGAEQLLAHLGERLPRHMLPAAVCPLDRLPLTRHGKLDPRALPMPQPAPPAAAGEPQTAVSADELRILRIWSELLDVAQPSRHDDFFRSGGHSLLATRLVARVQADLGVFVPVPKIFSHPTPAKLAGLVARMRTQAAPADSILVRMGGDRDLPPVLCVHPIGGTVGCYAELARHLPNFMLVGVGSADFESGREPLRSIPAMAARYVAAARQTWPQGPYRIVGWSMGSLVAYEMAQQLLAAGETVQTLVAIDGTVPASRWSELSVAESAAWLARDIAATLGGSCDPPDVAALSELDESAQLVAVQRWLVRSGVMRGEINLEDLTRRLAVFRANDAALGRYRPLPADLAMTLVRAAESHDQRPGWRGLVGDRLTVLELPGNHYSLLRRPTVADLATWLNEHLADPASGPQPDVETLPEGAR